MNILSLLIIDLHNGIDIAVCLCSRIAKWNSSDWWSPLSTVAKSGSIDEFHVLNIRSTWNVIEILNDLNNILGPDTTLCLMANMEPLKRMGHLMESLVSLKPVEVMQVFYCLASMMRGTRLQIQVFRMSNFSE